MMEPDASDVSDQAPQEVAVPCPTCGERMRREVLLSGIALVCENTDCVQLLVFESDLPSTGGDGHR